MYMYMAKYMYMYMHMYKYIILYVYILTVSLPMSTPVNIWSCRQVQACDVIGFDVTNLMTAT